VAAAAGIVKCSGPRRRFVRFFALVALAAFLAAVLAPGAWAIDTASLRVRCTTGSWTGTAKGTAWGNGTVRASASGGKVKKDVGTVTCQVLDADPDTASASAPYFTPTSTGPAGERTDVFTAGSTTGKTTIVYTLANGTASVTLTFKLTIIA
jgi:hypothetical protein